LPRRSPVVYTRGDCRGDRRGDYRPVYTPYRAPSFKIGSGCQSRSSSKCASIGVVRLLSRQRCSLLHVYAAATSGLCSFASPPSAFDVIGSLYAPLFPIRSTFVFVLDSRKEKERDKKKYFTVIYYMYGLLIATVWLYQYSIWADANSLETAA